MLSAFALMPAVTYEGLIDLRTTGGRKLHERGSYKLSDELLDHSPENLFQFLETLNKRCTDFGWNDINREGIMVVREDPHDEESEYYDMIENYGSILLEEIDIHTKSYLFQRGRAAQDNYILYPCLFESLSPEAKNKVLLHRKDYYVTENDDPATDTMASAIKFLKVIIRESHLDSNAKTLTIRTKLSKLDEYHYDWK